MATSILSPKRDAPGDARQLRSRRALSGALLALLEERPFDQLTVREITARAGTGYATFFRHYPTKEALLGDIAADEIAELLARTTQIMADNGSYDSTEALCRHVHQHRRLWNALLTGGARSMVREEFIRQARDLLPHADGQLDWLPPDLGVLHGAGATIDVLAWWLEQDGKYDVEDVAAILHRLVIAPLTGGLST
ncbi:MAG: helix-turn-helix domain-containing protein [Sphingomonadaceae bacterium]|jgi:AcrR family transcriptional regulator